VIDATAAPGIKTTGIAGKMENKGKIFAFDQDPHRLQTLVRLTTNFGATNVTALCKDFLAINPHDKKYSRVEYILVDPSCSGSGIVSRFDHLFGEEEEAGSIVHNEQGKKKKESDSRLHQLAAFQLKILLHAMQFPNAKRIVYSTCSVHQIENEDVVLNALNAQSQFSLFHVLPNWQRRGLPVFESASCCLRTSPTEDRTIGFFVAGFQRNLIKEKKSKKKKN